MQPEPTMRGLAAVIRRRNAPERLRPSPRQFLRDAGVEGRDLEPMCALGADRLLVYRRLVYNRFVSAVEMSIPRSVSRRGQEAFRADVAAFLDEEASRSPYLRDIASEFVRWVQPVWAADSRVPAYLIELARHELLSFEIASANDDIHNVEQGELDLDRGVEFQRTARLVRYEFAVHELPAEEEDRTEPRSEWVTLLGYRDRQHRVRYLELGPVAAGVLSALIESGSSLRAAIETGCMAAGTQMDDEVLGGVAELLADLAQRGVLLGLSSSTTATHRHL